MGHREGGSAKDQLEAEDIDMGLSNPKNVEISDPEVSCFIPQTNVRFAWDATTIGYAKRCPRLYYYQDIACYKPREESVHLRFGQEFHLCMADFQTMIANNHTYDDALYFTVRHLMERIDGWHPYHKYKNRKNLLIAVIGYLDKHREDPAKTVILADGTPAIEQRFYIELDIMPPFGNQPYALCGYLDRLVEFNGDYFDIDYKTTTYTPGSYYWQQFEPENQMSCYSFATSVILPEKGKGVIIDSIQVLLEDPFKFTRGLTYRSQEQNDEWVSDAMYWIRQAEKWALDNYWPMNDTACDKYGGCPYREVCASTPGVRDLLLDDSFEKGEEWNPLRRR